MVRSKVVKLLANIDVGLPRLNKGVRILGIVLIRTAQLLEDGLF